MTLISAGFFSRHTISGLMSSNRNITILEDFYRTHPQSTLYTLTTQSVDLTYFSHRYAVIEQIVF